MRAMMTGKRRGISSATAMTNKATVMEPVGI